MSNGRRRPPAKSLLMILFTLVARLIKVQQLCDLLPFHLSWFGGGLLAPCESVYRGRLLLGTVCGSWQKKGQDATMQRPGADGCLCSACEVHWWIASIEQKIKVEQLRWSKLTDTAHQNHKLHNCQVVKKNTVLIKTQTILIIMARSSPGL